MSFCLLSFIIFEITVNFIPYICVSVCRCVHHHLHVEVRRQFTETRSLLPPCGSQGSSSGHQTWQQAPLPGDDIVFGNVGFPPYKAQLLSFPQWRASCCPVPVAISEVGAVNRFRGHAVEPSCHVWFSAASTPLGTCWEAESRALEPPNQKSLINYRSNMCAYWLELLENL